MKSEIEEFREKVEDEKGSLDGWCHFCAVKLAEFLDDEGYSPVIVWGCLDDGPSNVKEMEKETGMAHLWVSLNGTRKCLDLYSNTSDRGSVLVLDKPPSEYYELARIDYKRWMSPSDFVSFSDYKDLKSKGLVIEEK